MPADRGTHRAGGSVDGLIACAIVAVCAVIVAVLAWSRPATAPSSVSYTQSGRLSYHAPTGPDSVYGSAGLVTGQPVYAAEVSSLALSYTYGVRSAAGIAVTGREQLVATISDGNGLSRSIPIQANPTPFTGSAFTAAGTLRLADLQNAAAAFGRAAGIFGASTFPVTISPSVSIAGRLAGQPLSASFSAPIKFSYTSGNLFPGSGSSGGANQSSLTSTATGSVTVPGGKSATLLLGISVSAARIGSLAVLIVALLLGGLAGWPLLRRATSEDERDRIAARHGSMIVEAEAVAPHPGVTVVQLAAFEDLMRVARRLESPILHWGDIGDVYAVVDSGTLYRYRAGVSWANDLLGRPGPDSAAVSGGDPLGAHRSAPPSRP